MEMTNKDLITNHNRLFAVQNAEKTYYKDHGEPFFKGRIKITYAIKKNMGELKEKLKPYDESYTELRKEYFDVEAEETDYQNRLKAYREAKDVGNVTAEPKRKDILLEGKDKAEYEKKLQELLEIKVKDVSIHTIPLELLDEIPLASGDLDALAFMISDF